MSIGPREELGKREGYFVGLNRLSEAHFERKDGYDKFAHPEYLEAFSVWKESGKEDRYEVFQRFEKNFGAISDEDRHLLSTFLQAKTRAELFDYHHRPETCLGHFYEGVGASSIRIHTSLEKVMDVLVLEDDAPAFVLGLLRWLFQQKHKKAYFSVLEMHARLQEMIWNSRRTDNITKAMLVEWKRNSFLLQADIIRIFQEECLGRKN